MSCGVAIIWKSWHSEPKAAIESLAPDVLGTGDVILVLQSLHEGPASSQRLPPLSTALYALCV